VSAAFRFRLQALLEYKARIEDQCRREAAAAAKACGVERERLGGILAQLNAPVDSQAFGLHSLHAEYLDRAIAAQEAVVRTCEVAEATTQERLRDAATQKLALEKLSERRRKAHAVAQDAAEQLELDETNRR
jgi:flagellar biosynthesis chaperone FliJ